MMDYFCRAKEMLTTSSVQQNIVTVATCLTQLFLVFEEGPLLERKTFNIWKI